MVLPQRYGLGGLRRCLQHHWRSCPADGGPYLRSSVVDLQPRPYQLLGTSELEQLLGCPDRELGVLPHPVAELPGHQRHFLGDIQCPATQRPSTLDNR